MDCNSGPGGSGRAASAAASAAWWKATGSASSARQRGQVHRKPRSRSSHSRRDRSGWCVRSGMYDAVTSCPAPPQGRWGSGLSTTMRLGGATLIRRWRVSGRFQGQYSSDHLSGYACM